MNLLQNIHQSFCINYRHTAEFALDVLLGQVDIDFNKWMKWCWKLLVIEFVLCLVALGVGLLVY